ncbi:hypothetical protein B0H13DRAFT_1878625 [Mycena leptocephala]|nr:hypothetical protein B0H13DRAFT_1878625 [Mycena leptocephala]
MFNPYAQGGWRNTANPNALRSFSSLPPQPSIFGALPFPTQTPTPFSQFELARGVEEHSKSDSGVSVVMRKYTRDCGPVTVEFNISGFKEVKLKESRVGHYISFGIYNWRQLYAAALGQPQVYAQVSRDEDWVTLESTLGAIQIGLLELYVTTFLLQPSSRYAALHGELSSIHAAVRCIPHLLGPLEVYCLQVTQFDGPHTGDVSAIHAVTMPEPSHLL